MVKEVRSDTTDLLNSDCYLGKKVFDENKDKVINMIDELTQIRNEGDKVIIDVLNTHVDFRNSDQLKSKLMNLYQNGHCNLLLNLGNVNFMDSSGLSVLLVGKRGADEMNGSFAVYGLKGYVNNLIELTNLNRAISIYQTEGEALVS